MERTPAAAAAATVDAGDELSEADVLDTINYFVRVDTSRIAGVPTESLATPTGSSSGGRSSSSSPLALDGDESGDARESRTLAEPCCAASAAAKASPARAGAFKSNQRQELAYLKTKVRELEQELRRVEQANDAKLVQEGDSLWQRVAQQQSIERQKALSENARLKEQLEAQLKFAKSLEKIIRKRPNLTAFGGGCPPLERRKRRSAASEKNLQDRLMASAEHAFERTDDVLRDIGASDVFTDHRSVDIRVCKAEGGRGSSAMAETIRVETVEVRRFPFPYQSVVREWWAFIAQASRLEQLIDGLSRTVDSTNDAHFATTSMEIPVGDHVAVMNASAAIRRFDAADRTVFAYVSHGDCGAKRNAKGKFTVVEMGWIRVMPLPGSPDSCILQSAGHFTPTHCCVNKLGPDDLCSSDSDDKERCAEHAVEAGILSEVIYSAYQKAATYIYTAIENALMHEHLERKQVTKGI